MQRICKYDCSNDTDVSVAGDIFKQYSNKKYIILQKHTRLIATWVGLVILFSTSDVLKSGRFVRTYSMFVSQLYCYQIADVN